MATYGQLVEFGPYFSGAALCTLKVYHYISDTTTLKHVYTDRAKTTTAAQPVVSDAAGIVSFYGDGLYTFRIDGSTDGVTYSTLYTYHKWAVGDQSGTLSGEGSALASASTLTLGTDGDFFHVTGTVATTSISGTQNEVTLVADGAWPLTHSGSLILQYGASYTCAAGNVLKFRNEGADVWREVSRTPAFADIAAKGDLVAGTANDAQAVLTAGANGTILMARSAATSGLAYVAALNKAIYGLTYDNGTDATNDLNINTGGCLDATGAYWMTLATALGKQSDVAWAVGGTTGTPAGCLDTGAVGNSDYYLWLIARSDTGVVDALCSLSSTAPTMPASYDFKRLFGWFKRVGGTIVAFHTYETEGGGLEMAWDSPTLDISLSATLTTTRRTDAVKVPLGFSTIAELNVFITDTSAAQQAYIYCPDRTDLAPSNSVAPLSTVGSDPSSVAYGASHIFVRTSSAGLIASRSSLSTVDNYYVSTLGFTWARRN